MLTYQKPTLALLSVSDQVGRVYAQTGCGPEPEQSLTTDPVTFICDDPGFCGPVGHVVTFDFSIDALACDTQVTVVTEFLPGITEDYELRVFDPGNNEVGCSDGSGAVGTEVVVFQANTTGIYTVTASNDNAPVCDNASHTFQGTITSKNQISSPTSPMDLCSVVVDAC